MQNFDSYMPSGITTTDDLDLLKIFPKPAANNIIILGEAIENGNYTFTLENIIGNVLDSENIKVVNNAIYKSFSISELPDGIYYLIIRTHTAFCVRNFCKQNL
jgi:hypothetical protein